MEQIIYPYWLLNIIDISTPPSPIKTNTTIPDEYSTENENVHVDSLFHSHSEIGNKTRLHSGVIKWNFEVNAFTKIFNAIKPQVTNIQR